MAYIKGVSKYCDTWRDALNELQVTVEGLKAENARLRAQVPKWIPCSERLPKETIGESEDVLITFLDKSSLGTPKLTSIGWTENGEWRATTVGHVEVIAWMPLPEPYKGGEADG